MEHIWSIYEALDGALGGTLYERLDEALAKEYEAPDEALDRRFTVWGDHDLG